MENLTHTSIPTSKEVKVHPYTGSKLQYKDRFDDVLKKSGVKKVKNYMEVFSGSLASMFHNLQHIEVTGKIIINDINEKLINLYKNIQSSPKDIFNKYERLEKQFNSMIPEDIQGIRVVKKENREEYDFNKRFYYECRDLLNDTELNIDNSSLLLFVLNHNFNGLYSENKKGHINVSFNWSSKPIDTQKIKLSIMKLHKFFNENEIVFETLSSDELIEKYNEKDTFIYLDPPYSNSTIQYTSKNKDSFNNVETHRKMLESCKKYNYVMYSNNNEEQLHHMFDTTLNFNRSSSLKTNKSKMEMLSFKSNMVHIQYISPNEILGISKVDLEPVNNVVEKAIEVQSNETEVIAVGCHFSGIGSVDEAIKQMKEEGLFTNVEFKVVYAIEWDEQVREVYMNNYDLDTQHFYTDIKEVDETVLPKVDVIVTSPVCCSFSVQGQRGGFNDTRGTLIFDSLSIIKHQKPMYVLYENVKGLITIDNGNTFNVIQDAFETIGYNNNWKILNALDFNLPQNRERIFGILSRKDMEIVPFPIGQRTTKSLDNFLEDDSLIDDSYYLDDEYVVENPKYNPTSKGVLSSTQTHMYLKTNFMSDKRIQSSSGYCGTLTTSSSNCKIFIKETGVVRSLTPRERIRLQGFSDEFILPRKKDGTIHKSLSGLISGNTIPVTLTKALLTQVLHSIENKSIPMNSTNHSQELIEKVS